MNGVAMSGVTANQAELMESDEHLRSLMEYLEIAKGEQEAAEAASAALKKPEAHRTPLECYEKQQLPVAASLPEHAKVSVEIHEMLQAANPNPNPSPNLNLSPSLALVLTLILTLTPQENFERLSVAERRPYEEESEMDLGRHRTACEAHAASKEAAQKLCFTKNKQAATP